MTVTNVLTGAISFLQQKWVHAAFVALCTAAPVFFATAGMPEPAFLQPVLNLAAAGAISHGVASYLDAAKSNTK